MMTHGGAMKILAIIPFLFALLIGCGKSSSNVDSQATTPPRVDNPNEPVPPTAEDIDQPWSTVELKRWHEGPECVSTSFLIDDNGDWTAANCTVPTHGSLGTNEQTHFENLATAALNASRQPEV